LQDPPKFTQIGIFGLKTNHLATLAKREFECRGCPTPGLPDGWFSNQKSQIWVNFGGPLNGKCWYILCSFGIFYVYLV
jgi:hypothetical protein